MATITPDPIDAATPPDGELVLNVPIEIRALKARVNALAGIPADTANYYRRNLLDNSAFQIIQRRNNILNNVSAVYTTARVFFYDRWALAFSAGVTATVAAITASEVASPSKRKYGVNVTSAITPQAVTITQRIRTARIFEGKTLVLSGLIDVPAAVLAAGAVSVSVSLNYGTGGTPATQALLASLTITASGVQTFELEVDVPNSVDLSDYGTDSNEYLFVQLYYFVVQNQPVYVGYMQLEEGAAASPYEMRTIQEERERCEYHFQTSYGTGFSIGQVTESGKERFQANTAVTAVEGGVRFRRTMVAVPSVILYSPATANTFNSVRNETAAAEVGSSVAANVSTQGFSNVTLGSSAVADNFYSFHWIADAEL